MRILSWALLTVVMLLILLGGIGSIAIAYFADPSSDIIVGAKTLDSLALDADVTNALRGRRGTAAAFALGYACILLFVVLGPYRKGAVWAWWAILCSSVVLGGAILLRIVALGTMQGALVGGFMLLVVIPALLLDVKRVAGETEDAAGKKPPSVDS